MATSLNGSKNGNGGERGQVATVADIVARAQGLFEDLSFTAAREWKARAPSRKVVGYMPIYVPRELIHAAGFLPLGILGGGDRHGA